MTKKHILFFAFLSGLLAGLCISLETKELKEPKSPAVATTEATHQETKNLPRMEPLMWEKNNPARKQWSEYLYTQIEKSFDILDSADDMEYFCSNYKALSNYQKINVWGQLFAVMAFYESSFNPSIRHVEPMSEIDPVTKSPIVSEGLLQLGYSDILYHGCNFDWDADSQLDVNDPKKSIFNPYKNLNCGVKIMTNQIKKHGSIIIDRGAYWAVIKTGYRNEKLTEIKNIVSKYYMCNDYE